jgi:hypothetical protein
VTAARQFPNYHEKNAAASDLKLERGHDLMDYFLRHGLLG